MDGSRLQRMSAFLKVFDAVGVQFCLRALSAARVDKPRKEEAAVAGCCLWGKSNCG
jgi:hypothetical protein